MQSRLPPPSPSCPRPWLLRSLAIVGVAMAGAVLASFSADLNPRFLNLPASVDSQLAILEKRMFFFGEANIDFPSWRNRILVPLAMRAVSTVTHAGPGRSYLLVRWLTACLALAAFARLVRSVVKATPWFCWLASGGLALSLFPTFLHIYEVPSDFLDATFFSLLLLCVLEHRRTALALIMLVALFNRESAIFAIIVWWAVHAWPFNRRVFVRETLFCLGLGLVGSAIVITFRIHNAVAAPHLASGLQPFDPALMFGVHVRKFRAFAAHPYFGSPIFFLLAYALFVILAAAAYWRVLPARLRRLAWVVPILFVISIVYSNIDELRVNIPSLVICTFLLAWLASGREGERQAG